jgi:hypothetical protein
METFIKVTRPLIIACIVLLVVNCKNTSSPDGIVGRYESVDANENQKIVYHITYIKDNLYGIKVNVFYDGFESQTDYLEGSYNPVERILTTKRSNVVLNYQFSSDYKTVELLGDENDIKLIRK